MDGRMCCLICVIIYISGYIGGFGVVGLIVLNIVFYMEVYAGILGIIVCIAGELGIIVCIAEILGIIMCIE
ncbi:hypothetical protein IC582_011363 [Cucumis melo]